VYADARKGEKNIYIGEFGSETVRVHKILIDAVMQLFPEEAGSRLTSVETLPPGQ